VATYWGDAIAELYNRAVDLELESRRESVCVLENAGRYVYGPMARLLATWSQWLLLDVELEAEALWALVDTLLWINAIGSGADPELTDSLMVLIEEQAQRVFEENLVDTGTSTDGDACRATAPCLALSPDVDLLLLAGDRRAHRTGREPVRGRRRRRRRGRQQRSSCHRGTTSAGSRSTSHATAHTGVGVRPELAWEPVQGAQRYSLTLHREDEAAAYWAWSGTETTVRVGPTEDLSVGGAHVEPGMTWWVVAFDETGTVVAQSGERPIAP